MSPSTTARRRVVGRVLVLLSVLAVGLALPVLPSAQAVMTPQPLNDTRPVTAAPVEVDFAIEHFGVVADLPSTNTHLDDHGPAPYGEARFRVEGEWTPWQVMGQDGAQMPGQFTGALLAVDRADAYQVRGLPALAREWRAAAINVSDGPRVVTGHRPADSVADAYPACMSRADWGADETITAWSKGESQAFAPLQVMTVHHTAGSNDPYQDYAATVRAIYNYHVKSNRWSDIGYQYLVDRHGTVYEGRNAWWDSSKSRRNQEPSRSCLSSTDPALAGDGTDFAHRTNLETGVEEIVTGAHTGGYNTGNAGIALMGCFDAFSSTCTGDVNPPPDGLRRVEDQLGKLAIQHGKDPLGSTTYTNANGAKENVSIVSGHRDWTSTACPGDRVYAVLPDIRQNAADLASGPQRVLDLAASASGADVTLTWTPKAGVRYEVYRATAAPSPGPTLAGSTEVGEGAWTDTGLGAGDYYYVIRGVETRTAGDGTTRDVPGVTSNQAGVKVSGTSGGSTDGARITAASCTDATCSFTGSGPADLVWTFHGPTSLITVHGSEAEATFSDAGEHAAELKAGDGSTDVQPVSCTWTRGNRKLTCTTPLPD